ncbi:MAG: molybdenum-dependent transcriptional regulator [Candidatus Odinarchaeum yellowstonii]|uniref:Molybdenum-dependent transcriptional regulator n=1 Tax=Odinarchaeota yellowstonii (strain LCB_4) TaxID=1841599 RepID=A0AAF0IBV0_ODILC|nr:MAG: molybdenum-dependent transcriptional regulator [Candidatus Odinarchaeum yellowstonii]
MNDKLKVNFKLWLEKNDEPVIGKGGIKLLEEINKTGSLQSAIKKLGVSYRYAWGYLKKIEEAVGEPLIKSYKGGFKGGGRTELTAKGLEIIRLFNRFETFLVTALQNTTLWEAYGLKTEEINSMRGIVEEVKVGGEVAELTVNVTDGIEVVSIITAESIRALDLKDNDEVKVIIKATEITLDKGE